MKLKKFKIKNFRSYKEEVTIDFDNMTAFVGKNDVGKSTILEALDVFFNENRGVISLEKDDISIDSENENIEFSAIFSDLPEKVIIDSSYETTLFNEYLLNSGGDLEIKKIYSCAGSEKVYIHALHPSNSNCSDLLIKKDEDLRKLVTKLEIKCEDNRINSLLRQSVWNYYKDTLKLQEKDLDTSKGDLKNIWLKLKEYLPMYSLFQSDRKNTDSDDEVQDPLQESLKQILKEEEINDKLTEAAKLICDKLQDVSIRTLNKLNDMDSKIASSLKTVIPSYETLKWKDVFKSVKIESDDGISLNKRGSGVRRLVLINFFRAEAERRMKESHSKSIIYAIEEPETAQHNDYQIELIKALRDLSNSAGTQIVITTHSSMVVKSLNLNSVRILRKKGRRISVDNAKLSVLPTISLNEINCIAFDEYTEEYHNQLYEHIEENGWLPEYKKDKTTMDYYNARYNNIQKVCLSTYIRHQFHHGMNEHNKKYTYAQLKESINLMRDFILKKISKPSVAGGA